MTRTTIIERGIIAAVIIVIIVGALMVGSPQSSRDLRADQERSDRLQQLAHEIASHYEIKGGLPESLSEVMITDRLRYQDPETGELFGYERVSPSKYFVCANFATKTEGESYPYYDYGPIQKDGGNIFAERGNVFTHEAGYQCFTFAVKEISSTTSDT